jgi:beta-lactamase class A
MIALSDNTATNLVLDRIGLREVNRRMESLGLPNTKINAKSFRASTTSVSPERSKKFGLGSTTAREMVALFEMIQAGDVVSPVCRQVMLNHLKKCDDKDRFTKLLPAGTVVAHKTGSVNDARTDAGIIYLDSGPVALCVLTAENRDRSWRPENAAHLLCARAAKEAYDYFTPKK